MKRSLTLAVATLAVAASALAVAPPSLVLTTPADGASDVDPSLDTITLLFSQDMNQETGYSVMGGGDTFPELAGKPRWKDSKTFLIPVKLKPDHTYRLQVNGTSERHKRFRAEESDFPVAPYPVRFTTGPATPRPPDPDLTAKNRTAFERLRVAVTGRYSHADKTGIDWAHHFRRAEKNLLAARTPRAFATGAAALLTKAEDLHIWINLDGETETIPTYTPTTLPNLDPAHLKTAVPGLQKIAPTVLVGHFPDGGPTYLALTTFADRGAADIDVAVDYIRALDPTSPIILDVRLNGGGNERLARKIAALFAPKPTVYATHQTLTASGFSGQQKRELQPDPDHRHTGPVAVLMGPKNVSSAEAFLLMMRTVPGTTLIGLQTPGASGNPKPHDLGNGVTVYLPSWRAFFPDGAPLEGQGIPPDVETNVIGIDLSKSDPALEEALLTFKLRKR